MAAAPVLLKGGNVVNADYTRRADVLCVDGKIARVGADSAAWELPPNTRVVDCTGKLVMPGGIDPHTHLQMPFMVSALFSPLELILNLFFKKNAHTTQGTVTVDNWESGCKCAVAGGTTTLVDFIIPQRDESLLVAFDKWMEKARAGHPVCNFGLHCAITCWSDKISADYAEMVARGVTSFKHFLAYKGALMLNDFELLQSFARCKELGILPQVHAENGDAVYWSQRRLIEQGVTDPVGHPRSRPAWVEAEAVERACMIARQAEVPLMVVHNTCRGAVDAIARAQQAGQVVYGEATAIHLTLEETPYSSEAWETAAHHVLSPPLRTKDDVAYLWRALQTGVLRITSTDHCTFNTEQKRMGRQDFSKIPNGCPGLEERLMLLWSRGVNERRITPEEFVALASANIAHLFNLYPRKGCIAEGSDADIVVWCPDTERVLSAKTHQSRIDFSVFEGIKVKGVPVMTLVNGHVAFENGKVVGQPDIGTYVKRTPFGTPYARFK